MAAKVEEAPAPATPPAGKAVGMRDLYRFADARDWLVMSVGVLAMLASGANQPAQLFVFGRILDNFNLVDRSEIQKQIHFFAAMYALLGVLLFVTTALQIACFSAVAAVQVRRIRSNYFSALLKRSPAFVDERGGGALATSVLESTTVIGAGIGDDLSQTLQRVVAFVVGIGLAMYISWKLTLVVMVGIPVLAALVAFANKAYSRATKDSSRHAEEAASTAMELISSIRTVVALGHEPRALATYQEATQSAATAGIQQGKARALLEGSMAPIMFFMFGLGLWYGSKLVSDDMADNPACRFVTPTGELQDPDATQCSTGGNIMTAFLSILFGFLGLLQALPGLSSLSAARASARSIFAIIDADPGPADPTSAAGERPEAPTGRIELSGVVFAYPGRRESPIYRGLSLTIDAGKTVALAGPSGCGKSTLVGLLERFYELDAGTITLDGRDIRELNLKWLRSQIGLVSQEPVLFEGTIGSNISLGRQGATQEEVEAAAQKANAHGFVTKFPESYGTFVGERGVQLSGGQKQRIAIARAVVRDPLILVLDEATSALDTESEAVVQAALDQLLKSKKRTTIVIAHRLSTIREADKIVVISGGTVVEEGSHEELMAKPDGTYRSLAAGAGQESTIASEADNPKLEDSPASKPVAPTASKPDGAADGMQEAGAAASEVDTKDAGTPMRWLLELTAPEKLYYITGLLGSAITGLALPAIGFLMAEFIIVFFHPDIGEMRRQSRFWAFVFLGFGVVNALGAVLRQYSFAVITERMVVRVRSRAFRAILRQTIGWFDSSTSHTAGALVNQLANDCFMVKALTGERASIAISQVVVLLAGLYIAFDASWRLTLIMFGVIPLIVLPVALQAKVVTKYAGRATEATVDSGRLISETLLQMRTVCSLGLEERRADELAAGLMFPMQQDARKGIAAGLGTGVAAGVILLAASFQYFIGGIFIEEGLIEFGDIMRVVLVLIFMAFGMTSVSKDATDKSEAMVAARRIFRLVTSPTSIDVFASAVPVPSDAAEGRVELRDVRFAYPSRRDLPVYRGVSLTIEAGQVVALAGPSGCGKSTLVGLLERFYDVDAGQLLLDGKDVRSLDVRWLRSQIGLVSQEPLLFSGTIRWNIGLGKDGATDEEVERAAAMSNAAGFVAELPQGFDTRLGEKGIQLSGGQKQRIAIARAIVRSPAILVLDEATSALDSESERVVQAALDELMAKQRRTTIVIAHRLSTIRNADKICVFQEGLLAEEGSHEELMRKEGGIYHALVLHDLAGRAARGA